MLDSEDDEKQYPSTPATNRSFSFAHFSSSPFSIPGISSKSVSSKSTTGERSILRRVGMPLAQLSSNVPAKCPSYSSKEAGNTNRSCTSTSRPSSVSKSCEISQTADDHLTIADGESLWICAIVESRGSGKEIGVALMESGTGRCVLSQFADTQMYGHLLHLLSTHPTKLVLLPGPSQPTSHVNIGSGHDTLRRSLEQNLETRITSIHRKIFDEQEGFEYLQHLLSFIEATETTNILLRHTGKSNPSEIADVFATKLTILSTVSKKFFSLSAAAALFKYLEGEQRGRLPPGSLSISYQAPEGTIMVDVQTIRNLELIQNRITLKSTGTLFGLVNYCSTPMGERMLRMNVIQPMADPNHLNHRYDAIEELMNNPEHFFSLKQSLQATMKKRVDMDMLISQLMKPSQFRRANDPKIVETALSQLIQVRHILATTTAVCTSLAECSSIILVAVRSLLQNEKITSLVSLIDESIQADLLQGVAKSNLSSRNARLYAVRTGRDTILDASRQTYQENTADALDLCKQYAEQYNLPFKINFSTQIGYTLELPVGEVRARDLPKQFINVATKRGGKSLTMTTIQLKKCNQRMNDSIEEVFLLSGVAVGELRMEVIKEVATLYKASEALALVDVIASLTHCAMAGRYSRPNFGDELVIKNGRHPIFEQRDHQKTIPNDTQLGKNKTFRLLSGPNSSGKTTYLKQVALLTIMARIGSFVPAQAASFPTLDRILSRLSNDDEPEANLSTFSSEMRAMASILDMSTDSSLVLIDELGRATSTHEGIAIAHAISEKLIENRIPTIFATHFTSLASTLSPFPNFASHHLLVSLVREAKGPRSLSFQHRISSGVCKEDHYGLLMAKDCQLPQDLLENADRMARSLQQRGRLAQNKSKGARATIRRSIITQLGLCLQQLCHSTQSPPSDLRCELALIQANFIKDLDESLPFDSNYKDQEGEDEESEPDVAEFQSDYRMRDL